MTEWRIPLFDTRFGDEEREAVLRPLDAGWLTMGEEVLQLEDELRAATGAEHAIAVTNGTAALQLACAGLGIGPGTEVLCPTLTFVATANAASSLGARVRLCDSVSETDLTVDPESIAENITDRTGAIIVVHFAGFACRMDEILEIANERNIPVIEDAAHAVFTRLNGRTLGTHGRVGCFSFYSNKNATCGEGGALVTDDADLAAKMRLLRSHGMTAPTLDRHRGIATGYDVVLAGFNARIDEIRASLLRVQLQRLPGYLERRREIFSRYVDRLAGSAVRVPFTTGRFQDVLSDTGVHIMPVLLPGNIDRTEVADRLRERGIQTAVHYPPIHRFRMYREESTDLKRTADLADRELTLPLFPMMTDDDVDTVVNELLLAMEGDSLD